MCRVPLGIAFALVLSLVASESRAECPFPHPARAKKFTADLVQAFLPCAEPSSGFEPNAETESGVPSCKPAETFAEAVGSPNNSWVWSPKARGRVSFAVKGADVILEASLSGVWNALGPATDGGHLNAVLRSTLVDPVTGGMTVIDFPYALPFSLVNGKGKVKTALSTLPAPFSGVLTGSCRSMEIVDVGVKDPNASSFASAGVYLP